MKVKELLDSPEKWTKGCSARKSDGSGVLCNSSEACQWCLIGALKKCYPLQWLTHVRYISTYLKLPRHVPLYQWNDANERTFEEVSELVEKIDI